MSLEANYLRCRVGDLVMIVRSKNAARMGRIGVVVCSAKGAAAAALAPPEDLAEVQRRDWIVDFEGQPDITYRDGQLCVTHRLACADVALRPLRGTPEDLACETDLAIGSEA